VARAGFFAAHGYTPIDLRWYAGVDQLGYSLVSPPIMALLGVRLTGALAMVGASVTLAILLRRTGGRLLPGALLGVFGIAGNLVSGRVTYGLGVAFGLLALLLLSYPRLRWPAAVAALLTAATSPVAGLFVGLAGAALILSGRIRAGLLVAVPAAVPLALTATLFGDGGWMNISRTDTVRAVVTSVVVALLVAVRPIRIGAALSAVGVLAAALVHTPVGLNATRLITMFALPVLAAYARAWPAGIVASPADGAGRSSKKGDKPAAADAENVRRTPAWALAVLLALTCVWQPPVLVADLRDAGNPTAAPAYFQPLRDRLTAEHLTGRVEIPPTRDYWEAAHMGDIPLARGWLRQADIDRDPLFFTTVPGAPGTGVPLTPTSYQTWLRDQAVQFVAVPDAELSWPGRTEAAMVTAGLPYLTPVWSSEHWRLYAVADPTPIVPAPATMAAHTATAVTFDAPGPITLRVRYYPWLHATGDATVSADGHWTRVQVPAPGRYTLTS
jgi:hypothetical protein